MYYSSALYKYNTVHKYAVYMHLNTVYTRPESQIQPPRPLPRVHGRAQAGAICVR